MLNMPNTIRRRRGATLVESTIVLSVCLVVLLLSLETSLLVIRHNTLSSCARRLARVASLHGDKALSSGVWGPATVAITADSSHPAAQAIAPLLATMRPADVQVQLNWLDGDDQAGQRVRATMSYTHQPVVGLASWLQGWQLNAASQSQIAH